MSSYRYLDSMFVLLLLGLILLAHLFPVPENTGFIMQELHNLAHFPMFGILSVSVYPVVERMKAFSGRGLWFRYSAVLSCIILAGIFFETLQFFYSRNADLMDLFMDFSGGFSFLSIYLMLTGRVPGLSKFTRKLIYVISFGLLIIVSIPLIHAAVVQGYSCFQYPELYRFESPLEKPMIKTNSLELNMVETPGYWEGNTTGHCGELKFLPGGKYPGIHLSRFRSDWRGYEYFRFSIFSPDTAVKQIIVRINDREHNGKGPDRYSEQIDLHPGHNSIQVRVSKIESAPAERAMDLKRVSDIIIFKTEVERGHRLYIDNIGLE